MSQDKRVRWDWDFIQSIGGTTELYELTPREQSLFLTAVAVAAWKTRWLNTPSDFADVDDFVGQSTEAIIVPIDYCQKIADCIETSDVVRDAINNYLSSENLTGGNGSIGADGEIPGSVSNDNLIDGSASCSDANAYAMAEGITDFVFDTVQQFFDLVDLATNAIELSADLLDNAPWFVAIAGSTLVEYTIWLQDTAEISWQVFDSPTERQNVACDLYCIIQANGCELSFDDLYEYFAGKSPIPIAGNTLTDIVANLVNQSGASAVGNSSLALLFGAIAAGSRFMGIGSVGQFAAWLYALKDDTDNNYTLCDACSDWEETFNFISSNGGWVAIVAGGTSRAAYDAGLGWGVGSRGDQIRIGVQLPKAATLLEMDIEIFDLASGTAYLQKFDSPTAFVSTVASKAYAGTSVISFDVNASFNAGQYIGAGVDTNTNPDDGHFTKITLKGTGANPFA
jgi:hypothetical protein